MLAVVVLAHTARGRRDPPHPLLRQPLSRDARPLSVHMLDRERSQVAQWYEQPSDP